LRSFCDRARSQRGAAAVEAGLITTFLMPLMMGVFVYGNWFWQLQDVPGLTARAPYGSIQGSQLSCQGLIDRVEATVVANAATVGGAIPVDADDVTVTILQVLPVVGAIVKVEVSAAIDSSFTGILPGGGEVHSETTVRLDNVTLNVPSC
jgi:hypothetical protein